MLIYAKKGIKYKIVDLNSRYCEYCCIEVSCGSTDNLFFIVYRNPASEDDNNKDLFELFQEFNDRSERYKVIVGDFDFPHINWMNLTSNMGPININTQLIEKVRDCYLTQHKEFHKNQRRWNREYP